MTVTMFAYGAMAWFVIGSVLAVCQLLVLRSLLPKSYQWLVVTIAAMSVAGAINMAKNESKSWPTWLKHKRYRIETVIGQLVERFQAKRVWARDAWHFWSRWLRRILNHTFAVYLCQQNDLSSLRFTDLIVD